MDSLLSFPVGLFHPLQHAGLSRRSPVGRQSERGLWRTRGNEKPNDAHSLILNSLQSVLRRSGSTCAPSSTHMDEASNWGREHGVAAMKPFALPLRLGRGKQ